jgi:hypothetical protein
MSFVAIAILISSGIKKFQYLGAVLIGWCAMQFAEALLWMENPRKGCTSINKWLTLILIPIVLMMQPLGATWGSLFFDSWAKNRDFILRYSAFAALAILIARHVISPLTNTYKTCTTVTPDGHLNWFTYELDFSHGISWSYALFTFIWAAIIGYPLFKFWPGQRLWPFYIIPLIGFFAGFMTDSPGSIWCYITSYGSLSAVVLLMMHKLGYGVI